ncbi:MAG TPA: carbon-phosphorus lyase complex subunit PhnI [Rectinemataceae bacterium]|nr:carbon-phosphorus lyase complex subunit PhnI [Rectinemataceae bacterium]
MGYVAVSGGAAAIEASLERLKYERLKRGLVLDVEAVQAGMRSLIDQVMSEASLFDEHIAALCIKQAEGSPEEAVFLMRAFRSTLPRLHYSLPVDTRVMTIDRRISASFKDIPGGQLLGASCDYQHRLIDTSLIGERADEAKAWIAGYRARTEPTDSGSREEPRASPPAVGATMNVESAIDYVRELGLLEQVPIDDTEPRDVTKRAIEFPTVRSERLQILTRGQTGALTALGYAALRGYGATLHPTVGELRVGRAGVLVPNPLAAPGAAGASTTSAEDAYYVGELELTVVETLVPVQHKRGDGTAQVDFELGFGASFGQNETKTIAMSILDQCLESEDKRYPTQDEEFVLLHIDSVEASGFISHLKLPHYVTFQSKLDALRKARASQ